MLFHTIRWKIYWVERREECITGRSFFRTFYVILVTFKTPWFVNFEPYNWSIQVQSILREIRIPSTGVFRIFTPNIPTRLQTCMIYFKGANEKINSLLMWRSFGIIRKNILNIFAKRTPKGVFKLKNSSGCSNDEIFLTWNLKRKINKNLLLLH